MPHLPENITAGDPGHIGDHEAIHNLVGQLEGPVVVNVRDHEFGAVGDGVADDLAAIQAAILAAGTTGTVLFPVGNYRISAKISTPNPITLQGVSWHGSVIKPDSGITAIEYTGDAPVGGFTVRDLFIDFGTGDHANNIGIFLNGDSVNGGAAVYWLLDHVRLRGGDNAQAALLGKGIVGDFALEGAINNCRVEFFGVGVYLDGLGINQSNANHLSGCWIRQNLIGVKTLLAQNVTVSGGVIEGNGTGWSKASGIANFLGVHFENNGPPQIDVTSSGGTVYSAGSFYNFPINITGGNLISVADSLMTVSNTGAGSAEIVHPSPTNAPTYSGAGIIHVWGVDVIRKISGGLDFYFDFQNLYLQHANNPNFYLKSLSNTGFGQIYFNRPNLNGAGRIYYDHANNVMVFQASAADKFKIAGAAPAASHAAVLVEVNDGAVTSMRQVSVDAVDTAGAGFRALRVPN